MRGVTREIIMMLGGWADILATRGRAALWQSQDPEYWSYQSAVRRLRKQGLVAYRRKGGRDPVLQLLPDAEARLPVELRPEREWKKPWNGIWYAISYDIPEKQKSYRNVLRTFLHQHRMGGLHKSLWITHRDIRPLFADLSAAAGLGSYALLFEARTVLGMDARELVSRAWDTDRLQRAQEWFIETAEAARTRIQDKKLGRPALMTIAREELRAYLTVMASDPLLPSALWPTGYRGPDTVAVHRLLQREIGARL